MKDRNALIGTIVACTVTLLAANGGMWVSTNSRIDAGEQRIRDEIDEIRSEIRSEIRGEVGSLDARLTARIDRLADQVNEANERLSRIEGFLHSELEYVRGSSDE